MESLSRRTFLQFLLLTPLTIFSPPFREGLGVGLHEELGVGRREDLGVGPALPAEAQPPLAVDPVSPHTKPSLIYVNG